MNAKAFPHSFERVPNHPGFAESEGMNLRDYFAAKAMQSTIINNQGPISCTQDELAERIAKSSYLMADAMMKAREA